MRKCLLLICAASLVLAALILHPAASSAQDATRTLRPTPTTKACHICGDDIAPTSTPRSPAPPVVQGGTNNLALAAAIVIGFLTTALIYLRRKT
jgi:hypothetical protein